MNIQQDTLDAKIDEMRELLAQLERAAGAAREDRQHDEIERLEAHLENAELSLDKLGDFREDILDEFHEVLERLRELLQRLLGQQAH